MYYVIQRIGDSSNTLLFSPGQGWCSIFALPLYIPRQIMALSLILR